MNRPNSKSSRRAFFLRGGAALGAGVAAAASAVPGKALSSSDEPGAMQQLALAQDREAIRQLHVALAGLVENRGITAAAGLFAGQAHLSMRGTSAVESMVLQLRPNHQQRNDSLAVSDDQLRATATYHVDVAVGTPLTGDSTAAQMARLQGQMASHRWEAGRIVARYVKSRGQWKIAALDYHSSDRTSHTFS